MLGHAGGGASAAAGNREDFAMIGKRIGLLAAACGLAACGPLAADEIELTNGDRLNGSLVSLDAEQVVLTSETFGEVKIPREKVKLIGLGEEGIPEPQVAAAPASPSAPASAASGLDLQQLMNNPMVQQQLGGLLGEAMGGRNPRDVRRDLQKSRRDLQELADDLGGIEGEAIGNYVKIFDLLGGGLQAAPTPRTPEQSPSPPPAESRPRD